MPTPPVHITTTVSLRDATAMFHHAMRVGWFNENIAGAGTTFQKPRDSAFADREEDRPQLETMAVLGGRRGKDQEAAICMYVWDRGAEREIRLIVGKDVSAGTANKKIRRFLNALREVDAATSSTAAEPG